MKAAVWTKVIKASADPERVRHFLDLLAVTEAGSAPKGVSEDGAARQHRPTGRLDEFSEAQAGVLAAVLSGSQALGNRLAAHPDWLEMLDPESLRLPGSLQGLRKEAGTRFKPLLEAADYAQALAEVREFKEREMLRIAARDLARLAEIPEITQEISDVADVCLENVWQVCRLQLAGRYGQPYYQDASGRWHPTAACVMGMGKLGGQELNYSSDVDVIFVYSEEGSVFKEPPGTGKTASPALANHQFFNRLAEAFIAEVARVTGEGMLYRIDLRLRPEGDAGPLSRSLASYENYYAQWGQTWERMMLIKARGVAGDEALAAEFLEMVQPFRYPRSINEGVLREIAAMKDRIENEVVKSGELGRNVKLGRGGIREIEFVAQSLQLLHAGHQPFLQGAQTLPCLDKLAQYDLLSAEESRVLTEAYGFLRNVEHRLQMEDNRQTHTVPADCQAGERLARLMGFGALKEFETVLQGRMGGVRRIFDKVLAGEPSQAPAESPFPRQFENAETEWKRILAEHAFKDVDKAFRVLREFVEGPGFVHISQRTSTLAYQLIPRLFALCPPAKNEGGDAKSEALSKQDGPSIPAAPLSDPDRVVTRLDSFISAYGARATLFDLWNSNPGIFDLLLLLFDRSEFLAELAIRAPDLVDELVTSGRLRQCKTVDETLGDLRHGLRDEDQHLWLRRYHQAELMRIGLRDILGLADFEQYLTELSALADACLQYALEVVMRRNRLKTPPFLIVGLGKLGGVEIDYGSDLDIVFVAESKAKNLAKLSTFAVEVMDLLTARSEHGMVFHTDARLRPDGEAGLVVNTLTAYEDYYRQRAQLWEIQSLTRTRPVAGDMNLGAQFQRLAAALTDFTRPSLPLAAYTPDWKRTIYQMRMRIEKERTPRGKDDLAIKTGAGGLMDAEFAAQALCLEHGWQEANTLRALQRGRESGALPDADKLIENYRRLRRIEGILRRWSYEGETMLPNAPAPFYRVSVRCGFPTPEAFRQALAKQRAAIREAYLKLFR